MDIIQIPIEKLKHHPDNPRKDLGDLTELTDSIKANGVMQNLTVVRDHRSLNGDFFVVIGNRRLEAAKAAGLKNLPCVISEMDQREQIATMLEENMQRADLTVYEQAQGFQMMMDLGYTPQQIGEKTGFSETTVHRRLKMAELDKKTFAEAVGKQITMDDLDKLGQLESVKERNALLKEYGERNFDWKLMRAIKVQKAGKVKTKARQMLQAVKAQKIQEKERYSLYSGNYEKLATCELDKWNGKDDFIPKTEQNLFYLEDDTDISIYVKAPKKKKAEPVKKSPEELEREKQVALAWQTVDRITKAAEEMRDEFVQDLTVKPSNAMQMLRWTLVAALSDHMNHNYYTGQELRKALEIEGSYSYEYVDGLEKEIMKIPQSDWPAYIQILFEGLAEKRGPGNTESFAYGSRSNFPNHQRNPRLEQCYRWLTEFGYQMSDEERQMMDGTHPVFGKEAQA